MTLPTLLAHVAARWAVTRTPTHGWVPDESETDMLKNLTVTYTPAKGSGPFSAPLLSNLMHSHAKTCDVHVGTDVEGRVIEIRVFCSKEHRYDEQEEA